MTKVKTMVGVAVASALSWSYGAVASGAYGHMGSESTYGVVTPFSPNESGPAALPYGDRYASTGEGFDSAGTTPDHPVHTPLADNETGVNSLDDVGMDASRHGMSRRGFHERNALETGRSVDRANAFETARLEPSMANPETPWSPVEGGLNTYGEDVAAHRQQIAEVEQARIAAAEWNAHIAAAPAASAEAPDRSLGLVEPAGGTRGTGLHGSVSSEAVPSRSGLSEPPDASEFRSDAAGAPSGIDRTSAIGPDGEYAVPVSEYSTVGILEAPGASSDYAVWSVEPLTPEADLTAGDTVYVVPDGSEIAVFEPRFDDSGALGTTGDYSAGMSEESDSGASSL